MAEILLSLTIIGVVAAITLPSLTGNINERTWNTQRKALYSRFSQAISLMPALNGFGTYSQDSSGSITDTAAETFVTAGLAKVLKINNICTDNFKDCGIVSQVKDIIGNNVNIPTNLYSLNGAFNMTYSRWSYYAPNTKAVAFETANGESIVAYYNPICHTEYLNTELLAPTICVNFIYDLNGSKGPNTAGKDIGIMTVFNSIDSIIVAPMPSTTIGSNTTSNWQDAVKYCRNDENDSRLPNVDELASLLLNKQLFNFLAGGFYWSGTTDEKNSNKAWRIQSSSAAPLKYTHSKKEVNTTFTRCIRR
ncbi:MAG: hypothetical protein NC390_02075 [Fusobacterium sp.]|nr:hypothetical protein [Fusobacterium sp.]